MMEEKTGIEGELNAVREEAELCLLQMKQAQEELGHYSIKLQTAQDNQKLIFEQCALKDESLDWLRGRQVLFIGLIKYQASVFRRFTAINVRLTRALRLERDGVITPEPWLLCRLKKIILGSRNAAN
jgi:hypothetical protein